MQAVFIPQFCLGEIDHLDATASNYKDWHTLIRIIVEGHGALPYLTDPPPDDDHTAQALARATKVLLLTTIHGDLRSLLSAKTAPEIWAHLRNLHNANANAEALHAAIHVPALLSCLGTAEYVAAHQNKHARIRACAPHSPFASNRELICALLSGLPMGADTTKALQSKYGRLTADGVTPETVAGLIADLHALDVVGFHPPWQPCPGTAGAPLAPAPALMPTPEIEAMLFVEPRQVLPQGLRLESPRADSPLQFPASMSLELVDCALGIATDPGAAAGEQRALSPGTLTTHFPIEQDRGDAPDTGAGVLLSLPSTPAPPSPPQRSHQQHPHTASVPGWPNAMSLSGSPATSSINEYCAPASIPSIIPMPTPYREPVGSGASPGMAQTFFPSLRATPVDSVAHRAPLLPLDGAGLTAQYRQHQVLLPPERTAADGLPGAGDSVPASGSSRQRQAAKFREGCRRYERAQAAFKRADRDNSGSLDFKEFLDVLRDLDVNVAYKVALMLFAKLDDDKDGRIREAELVKGYEADCFQRRRAQPGTRSTSIPHRPSELSLPALESVPSDSGDSLILPRSSSAGFSSCIW